MKKDIEEVMREYLQFLHSCNVERAKFVDMIIAELNRRLDE